MKISRLYLARMAQCALCCCLIVSTLSLSACTSQEEPVEIDDGLPVVVSLGDSYSSGEGCDPYYGQDADDKYSEEDWYAHRSELSWPGRLVVNGTRLNTIWNNGWFFFASSGATAKDVYESKQEKTVRTSLTALFTETRYVRTQLEAAKAAVGDNAVDYVTITIGGNDVGFTDIVTSAAIHPNIISRSLLNDKLDEAWEKYDTTAREEIATCYEKIREAFGDETHILVVGYPTLLSEEGGRVVGSSEDDDGWLCFSDWEAARINANVRLFNDALESLVGVSGIENIYFVSVEEVFSGHEAYTDDPYIESIVTTRSEDLDLLAIPPVSAASMHPNSEDDGGVSVESRDDVNSGVTAYAWAVQEKINEIEAAKGQSESGSSESATSSTVVDSSESREIALVLDVSGSMSGEPLDETKLAAMAFVDTAAESDAEISLISYSNDAEVLESLTSSVARLKTAIVDFRASGGTNMESGLAAALNELSKNSSSQKAIVLMSDGEPNDGLVGDELIAFAESIRDPDGDGYDDVTIFALGFNESSSGESLLRAIASEGCYISVQDADDLEYFFEDMADHLNGTRFMYVRIACPVDVSVELNGETLTSAGDDPQTRTSFGSLTFEQAEEESLSGDDDTVKVLRLREGESYTISITGTGTGTMTYTIGFVDDEGRYTDFRTFSDIEITTQTLIETTAEVSDATRLSVDADGDGFFDEVYQAGANEEGVLLDNSFIVRCTMVAFFLVVCAGMALVISLRVRRIRRNKAAEYSKAA